MRRSGVTLVELLVVLAILAIATGVSSVGLRRMDVVRAHDASEQLRGLQHDAISSGQAHTGVIRDSSATHAVTVLPDGRTYADPVMHIDPATGVRHGDRP
jgi:prepilin-type N-terminal cleavage/methylation domain-containing protein